MNHSNPDPHATDGTENSVSLLLRWRGKQEGPYPVSVLKQKLADNEVGLLHEVFQNGRWVTIRDYLTAKEAALRAQREAQAEQERLVQAAAAERARLAEAAKQREHPSPGEQPLGSGARTTLLEQAVLLAVKPKYPKWIWFGLGACVLFWLSSVAWLNRCTGEWIAFVQACDEISVEMKSVAYQQNKTAEALLLSLMGQNPYQVLDEPMNAVKVASNEANRIQSELHEARLSTRFWLITALICLATAVWLHVRHRRTLQSLGYLTEVGSSPHPAVF
jgi:hypothetical protein